METVLMDARGMIPPQPLERAIAALDQLPSNGELTLILDRKPYPLFAIIAMSGFRWIETEETTGGWRYRISKVAHDCAHW